MTGWFGTPTQGPAPVTVLGYDGGTLTPQVHDLLAGADLLVGGARHLEAVPFAEKARRVVLGPLEPALAEIHQAQERGEQVVVVASGDPGFFGIVRRLASERPHLPLVVLPAVSSVAAAFGRLGLPWDDAIVVSAHGRPLAPALNVWRRHHQSPQRVAILTDADSSPARVVEQLGEEFAGCEVFERLGEVGERRTTVLGAEPAPEVTDPHVIGPKQALARDWAQPNLVVSLGSVVAPGASWLLGSRAPMAGDVAGWALPDAAFEHRDGMLTKREVRAVVLPRLGPAAGIMIWDIGAGSGSVAVECSRLGAAVVAVERDPLALQHISANSLAHHAPVRVVQGAAPQVLTGLPHPDAVFVGGGGPEVVAAVAAVRPQRVVVALATLERVAATVAALDGYAVDTVLVQVSHLQPLGEGHRLVPANPVFVVSGALP